MSLTSGTIRMLKNVIHSTNCSDEDLRQIIKHASDERARRSSQPVTQAPIRVRKNHPQAQPPSGNTHCDGKPVSDMSAEEFKRTWIKSDDKFDDGGLDYTPTKKEYVDDDFENAIRDREHIDNVMKGVCR